MCQRCRALSARPAIYDPPGQGAPPPPMDSRLSRSSSRTSARLTAADRRRTILDAALRQFAERGYDGASVDDIAADAGINVAIIYRHFKSKEELHATVLDEQWR